MMANRRPRGASRERWGLLALTWLVLGGSCLLALRTFYAWGFWHSAATPKALGVAGWQLAHFLLWGLVIPGVCWAVPIRAWRRDQLSRWGGGDVLSAAALLVTSAASVYLVAVFQPEAEDWLTHDWVFTVAGTFIFIAVPVATLALTALWGVHRRRARPR